MVKKGILFLCMTALIFGGCSGALKENENEVTPDFVLTYAENQAEDYPTSQGAYKFAELVKERTGGKIETGKCRRKSGRRKICNRTNAVWRY